MLRWKIRIRKLHLFKKGTIFHVLSRLSVVLKINFSLRLENSLKLKESSSPSVIESISNYQVTDCWLKKNWSPCKEREAMSCGPMDYTVHGILQARILEWVAFPSPGDLPNPGIKPRSPTLQADSLPAEPPGKLQNTGVGSLFLLSQIFLT